LSEFDKVNILLEAEIDSLKNSNEKLLSDYIIQKDKIEIKEDKS